MKLNIITTAAISSFIIIFSCITIKLNAQENDMVAIVNPTLKTLNREQANQIFIGVFRNIQGAGQIRVLISSNPDINEEFCRKYLEMSFRRFESIWIDLNVREGTPMPRKLTAGVIKSIISSNPSFIGFIKRSEADSSVKIIE